MKFQRVSHANYGHPLAVLSILTFSFNEFVNFLVGEGYVNEGDEDTQRLLYEDEDSRAVIFDTMVKHWSAAWIYNDRD